MNNQKILIVNDDAAQLKLLEYILRQADFEVLSASSGNFGFEIARRENPDLIISDVIMPDGDGLELCQLIRADKKLCVIPIILISGLQKDTESVIRGLKAGADDYLQIPYEPLHLTAVAARAIERKRTEDALKQKDTLFRNLIENMTDVMSIIAPDCTIIFNSSSVENIFGYTAEELQGKIVTDFIHHDDQKKVAEFFQIALENADPSPPIEYRFRHKNNSWMTIESVGKRYHNPVHGLVVIVNSRDISAQNKAFSDWRESEDKLRVIFSNAAIGIALLGADLRPQSCNPALEKMLGYTALELSQMPVSEFTHPEDIERDLELIGQAFDGKLDNYQFEKRFISKNGKVIWCNVTTSVIQSSDSKSELIIRMIENINDRKLAETALRKSEERFKEQYKNIPIPTFTWRKVGDDFVFVDYNEAAKINLPKSLNKLVGMTGIEFLRDKPEVLSSIHQCFDRQTTIREELNYKFRLSRAVRNLDVTYVFVPPDFVMIHTRDITVRRQTEEKLSESEKRYRLLFESNPMPMWVFQPETLKFLTVNDAAVKYYGYSRDEFLAMTIKDIRPAEDVPRLLKNIENTYKGLRTEKFWRHFKKNGELIDVEITQHEVEFSGGRAILVLAIDITERKKSEEAIRFQADLLDTVEQAVIATDLSGKIIYWNRFAHKLYGYTSAEAVGCDIMELTTPDIALDEAENLMPHLSVGKSWSGEFTVKDKDGKIFPAQIFNSPIHDSSGKLIGIVGISYDNSERRDAVAAIIEANDRAILEYDRLLQRISRLAQTIGKARDLSAVFNAIFDFAWLSVPCSGLVVSLYDAERSSRTVIYMWYNGKEVDVSNFPPLHVGSGLVGQTINSGEVIIENDYPATLTNCQNMVPFGFDEDERIPQSALSVPMKIMGKVLGTIEVQSYESAAYRQEHATAMRMAANLAANSIENVRLLERDKFNAEQLRQAQKLESVGRLAGGIAHDFNNMLTAINGYSDLTLRRLAADDPLRHNVEEIKKAGQRSAELTYQLLAFSRQQVLKAKVIEINEVVTETSQMLERLIGEDVQLEIKLDPQIGSVKADPGQLTQVIMNLAVNARDAMPNGGNLLIQTSNVILDKEYEKNHFPVRAGEYVLLLVADTGTGIEDEILQHIFEPFFTTKNVGKGTGLGLATVYGIVKQSGGYIWVRSDVGEGTTFKIYLPRVQESVPEEIKTEPDFVPNGTETILLVEDEEMVRNMSREILEECGYKVIEAENGLEALSIFQNSAQRIDLLMTDVVMPKMGGRELSEKLASTHPQIGVLFTSGYTDDTTIRSDVIETGANFIAKPYTYKALAKKIRSVLDAGQNIKN